MKLKEVKDKSEKLSFFLNFVDISKIRVLQLLNQEINKLENIQNLKTVNLNLLNAVEERWFVKRGIMFFDRDEKEVKKTKIDSTMYFLVDPKKLDVYSKNMLEKLEETLIKTVTPNDYIITFGSNVNMICQKLELNVIEHFEYSSFENLEELSQKVSALIEIGLKNNLFSKALMLITQASNLHSEPVVSKQILPFENILSNSNEKKQKARTDNAEPLDETKTSSLHEYILNHKKIMSNINIDKAEWNPNIYVLYEQLTKTIIKQNIYETKILSNIEQYNLELQLLEEKKNKLTEQQFDLRMLYNRTRKEEATMQSLLLYAAFKLREEEEEFPLVKITRGGE